MVMAVMSIIQLIFCVTDRRGKDMSYNMNIENLDKNFATKITVNEPDIVWFNIREAPFMLYGILYDEKLKRFLRMPDEVAQTISEGVKELNRHTSGGRVRFKTDSAYIAIRAVMDPSRGMSHMPRTGQSGFDLYRNCDGKEMYFSTFVPPQNWEDGYSGETKTFGGLTEYTINFPLYDNVRELFVGLKKDAILQKAAEYKYPNPIVFYGNSITQGGCASRPGNSYQGFISRRLSTDFINLGFSGNGKGEKEMANYIAGIPMSILVMDYDSNAPSADALQATHYPFYKVVREANPDLPIVLITHPSALHEVFFKTHTDYDRWGSFERRWGIIRATYDRARLEGDQNIYFVDGREIFKGEEWDAVTVDGVHPNDFGFLRFAICLEKILCSILEGKYVKDI